MVLERYAPVHQHVWGDATIPRKDLDGEEELTYPGTEMNTYPNYTQELLNYLQIENSYTTEDLARIIEVDPTSMGRRGVVTKAGSNLLIIFITLEKRSDATPYQDHLNESVLHWEGQTRGKHAERYMSEGSHEVFVFIRKQPRTPYTYYGRAVPIRFKMQPPGIPSQVELHLYEYQMRLESVNPYPTDSMTGQSDFPYVSTSTEANRTVAVRTAQGQYRKDALRLWGNSCAVTEVTEPKVLIASHIKPWRESTNMERVDARNSLILSPTYDKLFDLGFITFKPDNGKIELSKCLKARDWDKLNVDDTRELKMVPEGTERYLVYHNNHIFGFAPSQRTEEQLLIV